MKHILLLCLAGSLLASCHLFGDPVRDILAPPDVPLNNSAKAWIHEQNGQILPFKNAGGQVQSVRVRRLDGDAKSGVFTGKIPIPHVPVKTEFIELDYRFLPQEDSVSLAVANRNTLYFFNTVLPSHDTYRPDQLLVTFLTADDPADEAANSLNVLKINYPLGPRTYGSVLHVNGVATSKSKNPKPTDLEEIFYSRADGLVGYRTADGQLWLRQ